MNWLLLTLVSALSISASRILQKFVLKNESSNPFAFSFVIQLLVAVIYFVGAQVTGTFEVPDLSSVLPNIVAMTLLYGVGNILIFKAFKLIEASEVTIILATSSIWTVISAMIMLGESVTPANFLGMILVLSGVAVINFHSRQLKLQRGHLLALIASIFLGVGFTNDAYIISHYQSISSYLALAFVMPALVAILYMPKAIKHVPFFFKSPQLLPVLGAATLYALAGITIFSAFKSGGPASIISPISQTAIIFTIILSFIFLKERDHMLKKLIGTVCAFLGVLLLV